MCPGAIETSIRTTVHNPTAGVLFRPFGLLRALETNRSAPERVVTAVMSQGPLMFALDHVSATRPLLESTMRHPAGFSDGSAPPALVGRLPTTTQPPGRIDNAVVSPMPPGQALAVGSDPIVANVPTVPAGDTCMIVVPVPCTFALSLKLLTSVSPLASFPTVSGTTATPYGLTSPLFGTVDATCLGLPSVKRNAWLEVDRTVDAAAIPPDPANVNPAASRILSDDRVALWADLMGISSSVSRRARRVGSYYGGVRRGLRQGLRELDSPR